MSIIIAVVLVVVVVVPLTAAVVGRLHLAHSRHNAAWRARYWSGQPQPWSLLGDPPRQIPPACREDFAAWEREVAS